MKAVRIHAVTYTAVNAMLVAIWLASGGVSSVFWPIWPMITWGAGLVIHGGIAAAVSGPGSRQLTRRGPDELDPAYDFAELEEVRPASSNGQTQRRWVVVMFVDIVGSTSLNDELGDEEWHRLLMIHRGLVGRCVETWGGSEVGQAGDGSMARFSDAVRAVRCAMDIQRGVAEENQSGEFAPQVRIGLHAGEAMQVDSDVLGNVVNLASRVADEAGPDEILVTEQVADQLGGEVPLDDRGLRPLKGLSRPRHLLAVEWPGADGHLGTKGRTSREG